MALLTAAAMAGPGLAWGQEEPGPGALAPAPKMAFEPEELALGSTYSGDTAKGAFKILNRGDAPLIIKDVKKTCGCTVVKLAPEQKHIAPGAATTVQVSLKPRGSQHESIFKKPLLITSNDPERGKTKYYVSTRLLLPIEASPHRIHHDGAIAGEAHTEKIVLASTRGDTARADRS